MQWIPRSLSSLSLSLIGNEFLNVGMHQLLSMLPECNQDHESYACYADETTWSVFIYSETSSWMKISSALKVL